MDLLFHLAVSFVVRDVAVFVGSSLIHSFITYLSRACGVTGPVLRFGSAESVRDDTLVLVEFTF